MTNMNTSEFIRLVDRWLFLAAFCLLTFLCGTFIFWLLRQLQGLLEDHKQLQSAHHKSMTQIIEKQTDTSLILVVCLDRNTALLQECKVELRRIRDHK